MPFWSRKHTQAATAANGHHIYVAPAGDNWKIAINGTFKTQGAAILIANAIGSFLNLEVETRGEDGRIRERDSHGRDDPSVPG